MVLIQIRTKLVLSSDQDTTQLPGSFSPWRLFSLPMKRTFLWAPTTIGQQQCPTALYRSSYTIGPSHDLTFAQLPEEG